MSAVKELIKDMHKNPLSYHADQHHFYCDKLKNSIWIANNMFFYRWENKDLGGWNGLIPLLGWLLMQWKFHRAYRKWGTLRAKAMLADHKDRGKFMLVALSAKHADKENRTPNIAKIFDTKQEALEFCKEQSLQYGYDTSRLDERDRELVKDMKDRTKYVEIFLTNVEEKFKYEDKGYNRFDLEETNQ